MWQTVVYLVLIVQTVIWSDRSLTAANEANVLYRGQLKRNGAPEINAYKPEIELKVGDSFELSCKAHESIRWIIKRSEHEDIEDPLVTIKKFNTYDPNKPYGVKVTIRNASAEVVGRYYCIFESEHLEITNRPDSLVSLDDLEDLEEQNRAISTYIFVKDSNRPLVPVTLPVVNASLFDEVIIPCKPSSKDVEVELVKDNQKLEIVNYRNDSTLGYVLTPCSLEDSGLYLCRAKDHSEQTIGITLQVMEFSITKHINMPQINPKKAKFVQLGESFNLVCSHVRIYSQDKFSMKWLLPNQQYAENNTQMTVNSVSEDLPRQFPLFSITQSKLTINRASPSDDGHYRCQIMDRSNLTSHKLVRVDVIENKMAFINFTGKNKTEFANATTKQKVKIVVNYTTTHLNSVKFYWTKDSSKHPLTTSEKYTINYNKTSASLHIKNPTIFDTGLYTVVATYNEKSERFSTMVYVKDKPTVTMKSILAKPNETVTFECIAIGYPKPSMRFTFVPCPDEPWTNCSVPISPNDMQAHGHRLLDSDQYGNIIVNEKYTLMANHAGYVSCLAENSEGRGVVEADLLVTDLEEPIVLYKESPERDITFGDRVTIVCAARVYNYSRNIKFFLNDVILSENEPTKATSFDEEYKMYSFIKRLTIEHADKEHEGVIRCQVEASNSDQCDSKELDLVINRGNDHEYFIPMKRVLAMKHVLEDDEVPVSIFWFKSNLLLMLVFVVTIIVIFICYCKKKKEVKIMKQTASANLEEGDFDQINSEISLGEQADRLPYNSDYEFPKQKLKFGKQLGAGAFGVVMKATAYGIIISEDKTTVAVKMVKKQTDNEVLRALIIELKIMVHLGHHLNVVNLLGAVTKNIAKRELMIIVEYCRYGNVQNFLLKHRAHFINQINYETDEIDPSIENNTFHCSRDGYACNRSNNKIKVKMSARGDGLNSSNEPLLCPNYGIENTSCVTTTDLVCWASQVACGMDYLATRKVLHGDLAARNILLCDDNIVKICDFGLARSIYKCGNYKKRGEAPLPFKWLALECISDHTFGTYSDVWAYGVMLWEFFSLARIPYPGMEANQDLFDMLRDGYRMEKPQFANQEIYEIMVNCWNVRPDSRPSFKNLNRRFNAMLPQELRSHYLVLNEPYLAMNAERELQGEPDYLENLGPPEEQAPPVPQNCASRTIVRIPSVSRFSTHLRTFQTNSASQQSNFDVSPFNNNYNNRHLSPALKHNLNAYSQQCSKRYIKQKILEQIPMLKSRNRCGQGVKPDSKTKATSANPMVHIPKTTLPKGLSLNDIAYF